MRRTPTGEPLPVADAPQGSALTASMTHTGPAAIHRLARVNIRWVTPLGVETASTS